MTIKILKVEDVLNQNQPPLRKIELQALSNIREPYRAILLQPEGMIEANTNRIGHADSKLGESQCEQFLLTAMQKSADIAVAPEYCVPWSSVKKIIDNEYRPDKGAIWVLGCESITPRELHDISTYCDKKVDCIFRHEDIDQRQINQKKYLDTLLYVFWVAQGDGTEILFLLAQFKTIPCKDSFDVEQTSLCLGESVYTFNSDTEHIQLISIICSDAFDFKDYVKKEHRDRLIIHIQLNPKPSHEDYAAYRTELCSVGSNNHVELLCLNWAHNIKESNNGKITNWKNIAGSGWYAPPIKFSAHDTQIDELHQKGIYYCILRDRWHAFLLNFEPHVLLLQKQKVFFTGPQAVGPKTCIRVEERYSWNQNSSSWINNAIPNDGFSKALSPYPRISTPLLRLSGNSPLEVERIIELIWGPEGAPSDWFETKELRSFHLDKHDESIRRITVHQEGELGRVGVTFRRSRLQRTNDAMDLPNRNVPWPGPLRYLANGYQLSWKRAKPHHNIEPLNMENGSAALVYLSDEADENAVRAMVAKLSQAITAHAVANNTSFNFDEIIRARDKLCIVYRVDNNYFAVGPTTENRIDIPSELSSVDIAGEE